MKMNLKKYMAWIVMMSMIVMILPVKMVKAEESGTELTGNWQEYAASSFEGGSGTETEPFQIKTADQLVYLAKIVTDGEDTTGKYYKLTEDIDIGGHQWVPIGNYETPFDGIFDGNGKKISNLCIGTESKPDTINELLGLFGMIQNATIKNVGVSVKIVSSKEEHELFIGGIVGVSENSTISNSYATGNITGENSFIGGLVGGLEGRDEEEVAYKTSNTIGGDVLGIEGLVGELTEHNPSISISNSYATVKMIGGEDANVGGVLGGFLGGEVKSITNNCYYNGSENQKGIRYVEEYVQEYVEDTTTKLTETEMKALTGTKGALVDKLNENRKGHPDWKEWGILEGKNDGYPTFGHSENTKPASTLRSIVITKPAAKTSYKVGESLDITGMEVTGTYSDGTTKGETITEDNVTGFDSSAETENQILTVTVNEKIATYKISVEKKDEPAPREPEGNWQECPAGKFEGGSGTEAEPFQIKTAEQLAYLAKRVNNGEDTIGKYYKLTENIDLVAHQWMPIGTESNKFKGNFDGNGKKINNVLIGTESKPDTINKYLGLFGIIQNATIKNVGISVRIVSSKEDHELGIGGLVGVSTDSTISNSYATGNITGENSYIGGLVGGLVGGLTEDNPSISISNSYATVKMIGGEDAKVGGVLGGFLAGEVKSITNNCYYNSSEIQKVNGLERSLKDKKGIEIVGIAHDEDTPPLEDTTIPLTETEMKALTGTKGALVDKLNENRAGHTDWKEWGILEGENDGYPTFGHSENTKPASTLRSIVITKPAAKTSYKVGESLDITGMEVTGTYSDGTTKGETITEDNVTGFDSSAETENQILTVTVNEKIATYKISVEKKDEPAPREPEGNWQECPAGKFEGGSGTEAEPFQIKTAEQLAYLAKITNSYSGEDTRGKYYKLIADIDLAGHQWTPIGIEGPEISRTFRGIFNGNGKKINNLCIGTDSKPDTTNGILGLFGVIENATIKNIGVSVRIVSSKEDHELFIGGIVGASKNSTIGNSYATGNITGGKNSFIGGIVGGLAGRVEDNDENVAYKTSNTIGEDVLGIEGLVGELIEDNPSISISNSYATVKMIGGEDANVGGVLGGFFGGEVKAITNNCYYNGSENQKGIRYVEEYVEDTTTKLTETEMKASPGTKGALVDRLNENRAGHPDWKEWGILEGKNDGYPTFGHSVPHEDIKDNTSHHHSHHHSKDNDSKHKDSEHKKEATKKLNDVVDKANITTNNGSRITKTKDITLDFEDSNLKSSDVKYVMISNKDDFKDGKWVKYSSKMKWMLDNGDGLKNVFIKFKDEDGTESETINFKVKLETGDEITEPEEDTKGNKVTFTKKDGHKYSEGQWTNEDVQFDFHDIGEASVGDYSYSSDGGKTWKNSKHGEITEEGVIIVKYKTVDKDGNEMLNEAIVKVDKTPPKGDFEF